MTVRRDALEYTVGVTVLPSGDAARALDDADTPMPVPISKDTIVLYTDDPGMVDVRPAFKTGVGTGQIMGYNAVQAADEANQLFGIDDAVDDEDNPASSSINVGADGMMKFTAGEMAGVADTVTVTAFCPNEDGTGAVVACTLPTTPEGSNAAATVMVSVSNHSGATPGEPFNDIIGADAITVGGTRDVLVTGTFIAGKGSQGVISRYTARSDNTDIAVAYYDRVQDMVTVRGVSNGVTSVTVTAVDSYGTSLDNAEQVFTVEVMAEEVVVVPPTAAEPSLSGLSNDPGKTTRYTIKFNANGAVQAGSDELVIEMEDFGFPEQFGLR